MSDLSVSRETSHHGTSFPSVSLTAETKERLTEFAKILTLWNNKINLVSPGDIENLWPRHIEDSLQLIHWIPEGARITDMGSGGGFPGLVLAIATGMPVTLIESDQRKSAFLREASRICGASTQIITQRLEHPEKINIAPADIVTARALASLDKLLRWARPLLREDGACLFLKGQTVCDELTEARKNWQMKEEIIPARHLSSDTGQRNGPEGRNNGFLLRISDFRRV